MPSTTVDYGTAQEPKGDINKPARLLQCSVRNYKSRGLQLYGSVTSGGMNVITSSEIRYLNLGQGKVATYHLKTVKPYVGDTIPSVEAVVCGIVASSPYIRTSPSIPSRYNEVPVVDVIPIPESLKSELENILMTKEGTEVRKISFWP